MNGVMMVSAVHVPYLDNVAPLINNCIPNALHNEYNRNNIRKYNITSHAIETQYIGHNTCNTYTYIDRHLDRQRERESEREREREREGGERARARESERGREGERERGREGGRERLRGRE